MSCLRLRKISNPLAKERFGRYDKQYIQIPDCKCSKCREKKKNDWLVRSYFEFTSKPSVGFFVTLDFDDKHLPRYNNYPCFDGRIIHSFCEVLRQACPVEFRYIICCDYGDALQRPHYHGAFIFDKDAITLDEFFRLVAIFWKYGSHTNIQTINTNYKNPFKAFEYVCKYSLKEIEYELAFREASFPKRYRCQVHSSIGYGAQCLDPSEFNSASFIKRGIKFMDTPVITKQYLKENNVIYISPNNDGVMVPYAIPRFYEMKLMYDYHWDSFEKKANLWRNEDGKELQRIRHNSHYEYYLKNFKASRGFGLCNFPVIHQIFNRYFPDSPYNGCMWKDIFDDVIDHPYLEEYIRYKDYFEFKMYRPGASVLDKCIMSLVPTSQCDKFANKYYLVSSADYDIESDKRYISAEYIDRCIEACFIFDLYNVLIKDSQSDFLDWQSKEDRKAHTRDKIKRNPQYRNYLLRKGFKFSKLNPSNYVSHSLLRSY